MDDILRELLLNGYMIYPKNGKFILRKEAIPTNQIVLPEMEFSVWEEAVDWAKKSLQSPIFNWIVTIRFNRGLGIEYKNLAEIQTRSKEEAQAQAEKLAERHFSDPKVVISEVRVRLKK